MWPSPNCFGHFRELRRLDRRSWRHVFGFVRCLSVIALGRDSVVPALQHKFAATNHVRLQFLIQQFFDVAGNYNVTHCKCRRQHYRLP